MQLNLGTAVVRHKAEIRRPVWHAVRELSLAQQLVATGDCDGALEPIRLAFGDT